MKQQLILSLFLVYPLIALSDEKKDVFAALEAKIEANLADGKWHPAAESVIRAQWAEYKKAHDQPNAFGDFHGACCYGGILCESEVAALKEYSGSYVYESIAKRADLPGPHLQIFVSGENRVFVIMDGRRIPAVVNHKIIFFTDGTFKRENAQFGTKPFATLQVQMIYKAKHFGLVMGPTESHVDDMSHLIPFGEEPNAADNPGAGQPATKPADNPPVKEQPSTPTPKVVPR